MSMYRNSDGYFDPTAGAALSHVFREERRRTFRPLVFICSPYAGDVEHNVEATRKYCKFAVANNAIPVAPHLLYPQILDDTDPQERNLGLFFGKVLMDKCLEVWIFSDGEYTPGMKAEYEHAVRKGRKIRYFTTDCREITTAGNGGDQDGRI